MILFIPWKFFGKTESQLYFFIYNYQLSLLFDMASIVTDFNEYKSYGNCLNEHFIFHLAILKGVARQGWENIFLCPLRHWRQNSRDDFPCTQPIFFMLNQIYEICTYLNQLSISFRFRMFGQSCDTHLNSDLIQV